MARFVALDGLRGIAAILVVMTHFHNLLPAPDYAHSGYLAVDFFFLLSGFVIAGAYDGRLAAGMGVMQFIKVRVLRLYPLYLLALLIPVTKGVYGLITHQTQMPALELLDNTGFALLMLPSPVTMDQPFAAITPLNLPAWSLVLEMFANVIFAATFGYLRRPRQLEMLVCLSGAALAGAVIANHSAFMGFVWDTASLGLPRVLFSFFLGVLIQRRRIAMPPIGPVWMAAVVALLTGLLMFEPAQHRVVFDLAMLLVVFPAMLVVSAAIRLDGVTRRVSLLLGDVSYAIYVLHFPLLTMFALIIKRWQPDFHFTDVSILLFLIALMLLSLAADRLYDRPLRAYLSRRLLPDRAQASAHAQAADGAVSVFQRIIGRRLRG